MLFCHWVSDGSYRDLISSLNFFYHRDVLLLRCIRGVALHARHRLAAAYKGAGTTVQYLYQIAADGAMVQLSFLSHDVLLSFIISTGPCDGLCCCYCCKDSYFFVKVIISKL